MNEKAILEIGNIIHVRNAFMVYFPFFRRLTPPEIMASVEYRWFKEKHPEICRLVEK
jgi:hypothetical protein